MPNHGSVNSVLHMYLLPALIVDFEYVLFSVLYQRESQYREFFDCLIGFIAFMVWDALYETLG